ncbi:hypothetical protein K491DRAFT_697490 [Lophiostoma macrostomum CBS 122681]|uniref:HTH araC/xylS-type domain-containing protein n=1 Tax=Lophiostoma macrostomum CBS 122681 TaxID=1314788 RepID=A0A6A6SRM8_9PLEO|nr:hypothetical protein K491DRAFT_697490 [Lophiostoma macrostomum CBS 122681]
MSYTTEAARWRALTSRDPLANDKFVYLVKSTNIYCRPTCPARLARRANVGFVETPAQAEAAGYRPCKRCKPHEASNRDPQELAVSKACALIEEAVAKNDVKSVRLQELAKNVGLTPRYFHKIFKDRTGLTPKEYAKAEMRDEPVCCEGPTCEETKQSPTVDPTLDKDGFDFNELMDFEFDPTLSLNDSPTLQTPEQVPAASFGQEIDVNILPCPAWNEPFDPNALGPEFDTTDDKLAFWVDAVSIPSTVGWEPLPSLTPALSTFELDAALILSSEGLPEILPQYYMHSDSAYA